MASAKIISNTILNMPSTSCLRCLGPNLHCNKKHKGKFSNILFKPVVTPTRLFHKAKSSFLLKLKDTDNHDFNRSVVRLEGSVPSTLSRQMSTLESAYEWHDIKPRFREIDNRGIRYSLRYVDVGPQDTRNIVLGFPSIHGNVYDFEPLFDFFEENEIRFIALDPPGMGYSVNMNGNKYDHSNKARSELIYKFLAAMSISDVDILLSHGTAHATMIKLAADGVNIHSLALLNPGGITPHRAVQNWTSVKLNARLLNIPIFNRLFALRMPRFYKKSGLPQDSLEVMIQGYRALAKLDFKSVKNDVHKLNVRRMPVLIMFSNTDKVISSNHATELAKALDVSYYNYEKFTPSGIETKKSDSWRVEVKPKEEYPKAVMLQKGGHYVQSTFPHIVAEYLFELNHHVHVKKFREGKEKKEKKETGQKKKKSSLFG